MTGVRLFLNFVETETVSCGFLNEDYSIDESPIQSLTIKKNGSDPESVALEITRFSNRIVLKLDNCKYLEHCNLRSEYEVAAAALLCASDNMELKIALAESCTGGGIAAMLTHFPGSSQSFWGGVSCYSNASKQQFLHVRPESLKEHGAVSETVAREMISGLQHSAPAGAQAAITGIAGPAGGSEEKPVGTVFIAVSTRRADLQTAGETDVRCFSFSGSREDIRIKAGVAACILLTEKMLDS